MTYKTVYTEVEVDIYLSDFETDDLIEELENRGVAGFRDPDIANNSLNQIWQLRRLGKAYDHLMDQYIYQTLGKVV